jgi:hypothetical protein
MLRSRQQCKGIEIWNLAKISPVLHLHRQVKLPCLTCPQGVRWHLPAATSAECQQADCKEKDNHLKPMIVTALE